MTSILKSSIRPWVLLSLMAGTSFPSYAQTAPQPPQAHQGVMNERDPLKRQEMMLKRQDELKAQLQLTAAQEPAWTTFVASQQPPADRASLRTEMEKLSQAERHDKMKALRAQREANASTFYAVLSADQKKIFDELRKHKGRGHNQGHNREYNRG